MTTRPGVNPSFDTSGFPPRDQRVIRRFAQHFYITRAADSVQVGNSNYRSFLMRPTDEISVVLNVEREIVVLFSDYDTFEARTLLAFDLMFDQFDDVRVDRSFRVLVSGDNNIENLIRHYLTQDPEYPIIIPFHYDDFQQVNDDFIFSAIRKNYLIRDLFGYQSPLRQEYFYFGREKLVESVIDLHRSGQNSGLFGLRKSGKTSTIFAIQRRAKPVGCRTLLIDCQDPAIPAKRFGPLLEYIVSETRRELNLRKIIISFGDSPDKISEIFRKLMNQSLVEAKTDILLIFDEIENISPRTAASSHWREREDSLLFWQTLRAYFQNPTKYRVTFCFVGTNPHLFELPKIVDIDNPVYLFAPKTFIPMLSLPETHEMVTRLGYFMGLDFGDTVVSHIHKRFGGHPFFIRQFCSQIHKRTPISRPRTVSLNVCNETERDEGLDIKGYLDEILTTLKAFYPEEHEMLELLAKGDRTTFYEMAAYSSSFVEHLIGYGIVVRRGDDFEFAFDAVAAAVEKNLFDPNRANLEGKRAEISVRRNKIEEEIRSSLFRWARKLSKDEWVRTLSACITDTRKKDIGNITVNVAFSRRKSPLNFIETLKFVQQVDEFAVEGVSISDIAAAMDFVNRNRIDAHAKEISDRDYAELIAAFELLESVFLPPE
jgi:hypothetical protein